MRQQFSNLTMNKGNNTQCSDRHLYCVNIRTILNVQAHNIRNIFCLQLVNKTAKISTKKKFVKKWKATQC